MLAKQKEIWRDIEGYEGKYQVSNFGNVKSLNFNHSKKSKILYPYKTHKGYLRIELSKNNTRRAFFIHRLVAGAFISNLDKKGEINHIDGNKQNNNLNNLEWVSPKENTNHAIKTGLRLQYGQGNPRAKISNKRAKQIREEYIPYDRNYGARALARKHGVHYNTIHDIIRKKSFKDI